MSSSVPQTLTALLVARDATDSSSTETSTTMPSLTTTTSSSTTSSTTSSTISSTTSMPKIVATTSTGTTYSTPTITPPAATNNPNIWKSSVPRGTVFIAVGSIVGAFFLVFVAFLLIRKIIARKAAKNTLSLDTDNDDPFTGNGGKSTEKLVNPFYSHSSISSAHGSDSSGTNAISSTEKHKIPLYENTNYNSSLSNVSDAYNNSAENFYSTLDNNSSSNLKRKSMFVSPTAEVMNLRSISTNDNSTSNLAHNNKHHSRVFSSLSNIVAENNSNYSQPRVNNHERDPSFDSYTNVSLQSPERSSLRAPNRAHRTVPSVYLDAMFEDE
ncbi:hypothetical protein WICMUC_003822 [Wickerhamomyces mucosus]|uniref:Mid2 domain-containing protein n=1 Tax=Wickerhamomyces mucosus TaxID=1378264 RepID=A0A9P8TC19_9ASCO|nr:hypothetical protein WICMUC_003822 [Wickerhamomyces mucosus]